MPGGQRENEMAIKDFAKMGIFENENVDLPELEILENENGGLRISFFNISSFGYFRFRFRRFSVRGIFHFHSPFSFSFSFPRGPQCKGPAPINKKRPPDFRTDSEKGNIISFAESCRGIKTFSGEPSWMPAVLC